VELGLDLDLFLYIADSSSDPLPPPQAQTQTQTQTQTPQEPLRNPHVHTHVPHSSKSLEELVKQDAHVITHVFDSLSMHVEDQVPAVLYLAYKYGASHESASTALAVSSSLPGQSAVRTGLLGVLLGLAHGESCLPQKVQTALEEQVWRRKKREREQELQSLRHRLSFSRIKAQDTFEEEQARARGAAKELKAGSHRSLLLRQQALTASNANAAGGALSTALYGVEQMLGIAELEHKGRITAAEEALEKYLQRAKVSLDAELAAYDREEHLAESRLLNARPQTEDWLRVENPWMQLAVMRCRESLNVSTHGILVFLQEGGDGVCDTPAEVGVGEGAGEQNRGGGGQDHMQESQSVLASRIQGCVVVLERADNEHQTSLRLQAAGARAIIYASTALPQDVGQVCHCL